MARPLNDSPYLYGLHDPGGEHIMSERGIFGWVLFTEALGNDPNNQQGGDYSKWANQGFGIIARLNNGYEPAGTLPISSRYPQFAQRCANFVRNSRGCNIWIVGNETNFAVERPGVQYDRGVNPPRLVSPGEVISPGLYANCYRQCRAAIRAVSGHTQDQVIVGAAAPWNPQTTYDGNPNGDWVKYLQDILTMLGPTNCDGISIHAYTHGADPKLIYTDAFMNAPFQNRQYNFRAYQDFMNAIPRSMRHLPVYLTETDQDDAWRNENTGWVQRVYGEIDWWNKQSGNQIIRAVILYRWPNVDKWGIDGKAGVIEDFRQAMTHKYNWETVQSTSTPVTTTPVTTTPVTTTPVTTTPVTTTPVTTTPVTTTPATPVVDTSPISFELTKTTAKGFFAAFYRQYGLDLTGYPINNEYIHPESGLKTQDWQRLSMEEYQGAVRLRLAGQEAKELNDQVKRLKRQIAQLESGVSGPGEPEITDITTQLPRNTAGFIRRGLADIQYVVISHTAVRPEIGADRVAQAHRARWPGIVGQYFITGDGQIQQTNPVDEVVAQDQSWIYNGLNVYVAGNFDQVAPSDAQMEALARLCAWLISKYNLSEAKIKGVSEFIVTHSPGLQWAQGQNWKAKLLEQISAIPSATVSPGASVTPSVDEAQLDALRTRVNQLETELGNLQVKLTMSEQARDELQAQVEVLQKAGTATTRLSKPTVTDVSLQLPRTTGSMKMRALDQIKYVVLNHTAVDPSVKVERIATAHQQRWGAILYQYLITVDGNILQTNALDEVVDLSQPWISQGINVAVAGNFTSGIPSQTQIKAAASLIAWLMQEHGIGEESIKGVNEFVVTQSPGVQWLQGQKWKDTLLAAIAAVQATAPQAPTTPTTPTTAAGTAAVAALRAQVTQLQTTLNQALTKNTALQQERDQLLARVKEPSANEAKLTQTGANAHPADDDIESSAQQAPTLTGEKSTLAKQVQTLTSEKTGLNQQLQALNQQVSTANSEKQTLTKKVSDLEARVTQLQSGVGTVTTGSSQAQTPEIIDVADKLPKHATERYDTRTLDKITHIAIHHTAAPGNVTPERIAEYHVGNGWPGIGYHST